MDAPGAQIGKRVEEPREGVHIPQQIGDPDARHQRIDRAVEAFARRRRERVVRRDFEAALLEPDAVEATGHQLRAHFTQPVVEPLAPACEPGRPVGVQCAVAQDALCVVQGHEIGVESTVVLAACHPDVAGAQPVTQRGDHRRFVHIGLDQAGHLPSFVSVTEGKTGDVKAARTWTFPAGSVVVADRAYLDFKWFHQLQARGVTFVTRLKRGVRYRVTREHDIRPGTGVLSDQTIELTSARSRKAYAAPLRRVAYQDPVTKNRYVFVTNNTTWVAQTIADIYKSRWQIELFFKWIKQHLKVKRFVGRSKKRRHDAAVGGDVHVPAVGVPEVRHAVALEPSPDAAGAPAQHV